MNYQIYYLDPLLNSCNLDCPIGEIISLKSNNTCDVCNVGCLTCFENTSNCLNCKNISGINYYLTKNNKC